MSEQDVAFIRYVIQSDEFSPEWARQGFKRIADDLYEESYDSAARVAGRKREIQQNRREYTKDPQESGGYGIRSRVKRYAETKGLKYNEAARRLIRSGLKEASEDDDNGRL